MEELVVASLSAWFAEDGKDVTATYDFFSREKAYRRPGRALFGSHTTYRNMSS